MTDRPVSDFMLSATLHAVVAGVLVAFSYVAQQQVKNLPQVMELVAGEGDNYGAKVAPALGTPGGVKLDVPAPPAPKVEPAPITPVEEPPVAKAAPEPAPTPPPKAAPAPTKATTPPPAPNFAQQIRRKLIRAESKAKADVAKERKAEAKRLEEEKKRMTKAEFDKQNKNAGAPTKVARIDAEGIAKGVVGGSTANKVGGAGGKALTSNNEDLLGAYFALFKQRLKVAFEAPDGLSDTLEVVVRVTSNADGSLTNPRVVKSSGSAEFDRAVVAAIRRVTMPARPDRKSEPIDVPFSMREREDR